MEAIVYFLFLWILAYLIGSIPFGLVLCRIAGYGDIRKIGSGNIGATNVLRTGNKALALLTVILDSAKGALALFVIYGLSIYLSHSYPECVARISDFGSIEEPDPCSPVDFGPIRLPFPMAGVTLESHPGLLSALIPLFPVLGHIFPVWLKFKGGKGVATTLGTLLAAAPYVGLIACGTWLFMALVFRISSLAALTAMAAAPVAAFFLYGPLPAIVTLLIAAIVWARHASNIKRLVKGEEPKIGKKKRDGQK